jgi:hypothetical protein
MNDLPPDPARLRIILAWLDEQIADNATVGTYLRLQRDAVTQALTGAEGERKPRPSAPLDRPRVTRLPIYGASRDQVGFKIVERSGEGGRIFVSLHLGDCDLDEGPTRQVDAHEAYVALSDGLAACVICRPNIVLGLGG